MSSKIIYNGQEYNGAIVNDAGVGEFTSNNGKKNPNGANNEIFNDYVNNKVSGSNSSASGSNNYVDSSVSDASGDNNTIYNSLQSSVKGYNTIVMHSGNASVEGTGENSTALSQIKAYFRNGTPITDSLAQIFVNNGAYQSVLNQGIEVCRRWPLTNAIVGANAAHNEGYYSAIYGGNGVHVEGYSNMATGNGCHAEGYNNVGSGGVAIHVEGYGNTTLTGYYSRNGVPKKIVDPGNFQYAISYSVGDAPDQLSYFGSNNGGTHIEGESNIIINCNVSHIEGTINDLLDSQDIHVEGIGNQALITRNCHMEGSNNFLGAYTTVGQYASYSNSNYRTGETHIEGYDNAGYGVYMSHIEGRENRIHKGQTDHIEGKFNQIYSDTYYDNSITSLSNTLGGNHVEGTGLREDYYGSTSPNHFSRYTVYNGKRTEWGQALSGVNYFAYGYDSHLSNQSDAQDYLFGTIWNSTGSHVEGFAGFIENSNYAHLEGATDKDDTNKRLWRQTIDGNSTAAHLEGLGNYINNSPRSHVEGYHCKITTASGTHCEGEANFAKNASCHIEGYFNFITSASYVHIENSNNLAEQCSSSHTEGVDCRIYGCTASHVEGYGTTNYEISNYIIVGANTEATVEYSIRPSTAFYEVEYTYSDTKIHNLVYQSSGSHVEGYGTAIDNSSYSHIEGTTVVDDNDSTILYRQSIMNSTASHAEGSGNLIKAGSAQSHAEGWLNLIESTRAAHIEGSKGYIYSSINAHLEGNGDNSSYVSGYDAKALSQAEDFRKTRVIPITLKEEPDAVTPYADYSGGYGYICVKVTILDEEQNVLMKLMPVKIYNGGTNYTTLDTVLQEAHKQYCPLGADGYSATGSGYSRYPTKIWGETYTRGQIAFKKQNGETLNYNTSLYQGDEIFVYYAYYEGTSRVKIYYLSTVTKNTDLEGNTFLSVRGRWSYSDGSVSSSAISADLYINDGRAVDENGDPITITSTSTTAIYDAYGYLNTNNEVVPLKYGSCIYYLVPTDTSEHYVSQIGIYDLPTGIIKTTKEHFIYYAPDSHTEGVLNITKYTSGVHNEGSYNTVDSMTRGHVEGFANIAAYGNDIHVEGVGNKSDSAGNRSHIEGYLNTCQLGSNDVHMEGGENITKEGGNFRHIEGYKNVAYSGCSMVHIEGTRNDVGSLGSVGHVEGEYNHIDNGSGNTHIEGYNNIATNSTVRSHIEGENNIGTNTTYNCHIEGMDNYTLNTAYYSHVEGMNNSIASSTNNHVEGNSCFIIGSTNSHIEGEGDSTDTSSDYIYQHSYLGNTTENGNRQAITYSTSYSSRSVEAKMYSHYIHGSTNCHIEGKNNITTSSTSSSSGLSGIGPALDGQPHSNHLEGCYNLVLGSGCHVEGGANLVGYKTTDNSGETPKYQSYWSMYSHAEGHRNKISGTFATHVEGILNDIQEWADPTFDPEDPESTGYTDEMLHSYAAHAEGSHNIARGYAAHAQGLGTIANAQAQATMGCFNVEDISGTNDNPKGSYAVIIGNGTSTEMEVYDNTETYAVDDEVIYEGVAYKCIVAVTEAEDFDSEKWDELNYEIIDDAKVTRSNAMTVSWGGVLNVIGAGADIQINGTSIASGGDIANPNISDAYDNTATYAVGDYCIYNNSLFKCSIAVTTAEDFDATKWTATTVGAELLSIISRISALETALNGYSLADN